MEDIAVQLFKLGDRERKGFIVKRDMQRLRGEVSLPPDQLEAVFESLDSSHNGYLTLDHFLKGINHFNGHGKRRSVIVDDPDHPIQKLLNLNVLHKSGELMCEVRHLVGGGVGGGDDEATAAWHQLMAALFSDLNQLLRQISQLEEALRAKDASHHDEIQRLYDELESQLEEQGSRLAKQTQAREAEMRAELAAKDQLIEELMSQRDELQERLRLREGEREGEGDKRGRHQYQHQPSRRLGNSAPLPGADEPSKDSLASEQNRRRMERAIAESYEEGYRHARHRAALEEEGLIKQLQMLQEMQETLRSGMKVEKPPRISYDDI